MSKTTVFISSTFVDLSATREHVGNGLSSLGHEPILFENGSVTYDPDGPLDQSCYEKVANSQVFVLIIGKRYGSPASTPNSGDTRRLFDSVTRREYRVAREAGLPIFVFVGKDLHSDYQRFQTQKRAGKYSFVSDVQILDFISSIQGESRNNPIFWYSDAGEIVQHLKLQLSGLLRKGLERRRRRRTKVPINCFKLFYFRIDRDEKRGRALTIEELAAAVNRPIGHIRRLETRRKSTSDPLSLEIFHTCELADVEALERELGCPGELRAGRHDDFLTNYLINYRRRTSKGSPRRDASQLEMRFETKAIVFDFDGTLTVERHVGSTWERLWEEAGLGRDKCSSYHEQFRRGHITHAEWCNITRDAFRAAQLKRDSVRAVAKQLELVPDAKEVILQLHKAGIHLSILSGSVKEVIKEALGEAYHCFDDVKANDLEFDASGTISGIVGTAYDYRSKPEFIRQIIRNRRLDPLNVLFVGNSANDAWASRSGARTLCVNPVETDAGNTRNWTDAIRYMSSLRMIMPYVMPDNRSEATA